MSSAINRRFIRARHAAALGLFAAICVLALGGALREAHAYHAMVQTYRATQAMQQRVVDLGAAAAQRAQSPAAQADDRLRGLADALDLETPEFLAMIRAAPPDLAAALDAPTDIARDLAAYAALGRLIAAPAPASMSGPDPRFTMILRLSENGLRPFFVDLSDRLGARHELLWARSMGFAQLGFLALLGGLAIVVATVLRPMERRILETQQALERETERARAAERDKGAMLAQTSHEIRTSLNGVIGVAELLARTELQPQQARYLDVMRASGAALLRIIDDVLDFSKIAAGEMSFERRRFDLVAVLEDTARLFEPGLAEKGLSLAVEIAEDVPREAVGDAVRLRQALSNLLSNAAKYTSEGGVTLRAALRPGADRLRIEVADTGSGIPPDKLEAVFESYRQLDSALVDQTRGTGLGLALTRSMIERMGGAVGVRSVEGLGSTFWVDMPSSPTLAVKRPLSEMRVAVLSDDPGVTARMSAPLHRWGCAVSGFGGAAPACDVALIDARAGAAASVARGVRAAAPDARIVALVDRDAAHRPSWADATLATSASLQAVRDALQPDGEANAMEFHDADAQACADAARFSALAASGRAPLVLVADDNEVNRLIAETLLRQLGCEVETATDGAAALRAARSRRFALILMDVSMPVMNGLDATRAIRRAELETGRRTPIVALTAHALQEHLDHCLDAGMDGRLVKPFRPEELTRTVARFLFPDEGGRATG